MDRQRNVRLTQIAPHRAFMTIDRRRSRAYNLALATPRGSETHSSSARYDWEPDRDDELDSDRIVPFPTKSRASGDRADDEPRDGRADRLQRRRRSQATSADSLPRHLVTGLAAVIGFVVLVYL